MADISFDLATVQQRIVRLAVDEPTGAGLTFSYAPHVDVLPCGTVIVVEAHVDCDQHPGWWRLVLRDDLKDRRPRPWRGVWDSDWVPNEKYAVQGNMAAMSHDLALIMVSDYDAQVREEPCNYRLVMNRRRASKLNGDALIFFLAKLCPSDRVAIATPHQRRLALAMRTRAMTASQVMVALGCSRDEVAVWNIKERLPHWFIKHIERGGRLLSSKVYDPVVVEAARDSVTAWRRRDRAAAWARNSRQERAAARARTRRRS